VRWDIVEAVIRRVVLTPHSSAGGRASPHPFSGAEPAEPLQESAGAGAVSRHPAQGAPRAVPAQTNSQVPKRIRSQVTFTWPVWISPV